MTIKSDISLIKKEQKPIKSKKKIKSGRYKVFARAYSRRTGKPTKMQSGKFKGKYERSEIINTKTNILFKDAKNKEDVKGYYEAFWDLDKLSPEIVKVTKIQKIK